MLERSCNIEHMNKLDSAKRAQVIATLVEGCSVNSTARLTGVSVPTILKLLSDVGDVCADAHDRLVRNVKARRVQADEIWSFVGKKAANATEDEKACGMGDAWVWTAIDADSKLIVSYLVGLRNSECAEAFITDLAQRLAQRVQLSTDGLKIYIDAVENAFGADVDYAQLVKQYAAVVEGQKRYSPAECCGAIKNTIAGNPDAAHINTSYSERVNLTIRMSDRRFTRLTNAFSKKLANHISSVHLHNFFYNFCRIHKSLRITPAMAAGLTDRVWTIADVVAMLEQKEEKAAQPKAVVLVPVKKRG